MASRIRCVTLCFIATLAACGGKSFEADELPNGGTGAGGTEAGGTEAGGTEAGGTGAGGAIGGTGAGGAIGGTGAGGAIGGTGVGGSDPECRSFDDEPPTDVLVEIRNETSTSLHLGPLMPDCGTVPLFSVADASGQELPALSWCRSSCQSLHDQGAAGCPAICPGWESITLQPMESLFTRWDGRYRANALLPGRCVFGEDASGPVMCDQAKVIRPGAFTFQAQAGTELTCALSSMCPVCTPGEQGGCKTSGTVIGGKLHQALTKVDLSPRAPFGGDTAGAAPAPVPQLTVTLVFTE